MSKLSSQPWQIFYHSTMSLHVTIREGLQKGPKVDGMGWDWISEGTSSMSTALRLIILSVGGRLSVLPKLIVPSDKRVMMLY